MLLDLVWLPVGLALIVKGGEFFVTAAVRLAMFGFGLLLLLMTLDLTLSRWQGLVLIAALKN